MYTLGDIPRRGATVYPDREAIVFGNSRFTYRELNDRVNGFANALLRLGYKSGDRLSILSENSHKYIEVFFACSKIGVVINPLNFRLSDSELCHILDDTESRCLLAGDGYEERSLDLKTSLPYIKDIISLDNERAGFGYYEDLIADASKDEPAIDISEDELAMIIYTGGTTGMPKGVMHSNRTFMTSLVNYCLKFSFTSDDCTCLFLPLFHVAFWSALSLLFAGGKAVILRRPEVGEILRHISGEKCTHMNAIPTLFGMLLDVDNIDKYDLSSLRLMTYGGSPFPVEVLRRCVKKFGNRFAQIYGMTEAFSGAGLPAADHSLEGEKARLLLSAGKEDVCAQIRIVDEDDNFAKPGEAGEIVMRGKHVMLGYWKNPELTEKSLRNGWYHTGDIGYIDKDGYLFLVDRKADMIITGGENVYPKETENVLYEHPAVKECAVVSAPDDKWGERVQAAVVLKDGKTTTAEELISHCRSKLAGYKCPKVIEFWNEIPKTPVGKILRKDVKKHFWKDHARFIS